MPKKAAVFLAGSLAVASGFQFGSAPRPAAQLTTSRQAMISMVETSAVPSAPLTDEAFAVPDAFFESRTPYIKDIDEYRSMYKRSVEDPAGFWGDIASTFHWEKKWDTVVDSNFASSDGKVYSKWFSGGKTNICYNALDRHVEAGHGDQVAFYHEANDEDEEMQSWTYAEALAEVERIASYLKAKGVQSGDRVTIFMPMVPQLPMAMLACARIGAVHSVVFGGFSAEALAGRLLDSQSTVVITADGVMRGAKPIKLYSIVDAAAQICGDACMGLDSVLVLQRLGAEKGLPLDLKDGRDEWWHEAVPKQDASCPVEWVDSEHPLFVLYTSGSTGKPKGVLHTTGGYMVYAATTSKYIFDLKPDDSFFCTADCGWITGHSYVAYGPLLNQATQLVFEGVPSYPDAGRLWRTVDKYSVTQIYTAPTAIRALMKSGEEPVKAASRSSLRLLGSVGEPINPEAWRWYHEVVGDGKCPIVDTWWQTETGGIMISPLPTAGYTQKPGCASLPFFGVQPTVITPEGKEIEGACEGLLAVKGAWPSTIRDVLGDYERYVSTYFPIEGPDGQGYYLTGDGARRDEDGYIWITGRVDDVINSSGHRIGTAEVESAEERPQPTSRPAPVARAQSMIEPLSAVSLASPLSSLSLWTLVALPRRVSLDPPRACTKGRVGRAPSRLCSLVGARLHELVDDAGVGQRGRVAKGLLVDVVGGA
jgi:acetyl-CoA synthetase